MKERTIVVIPAYNAERTLAGVVAALPEGCADEIIVVDDASRDGTADEAAKLPVTLIRHAENRGYGANQKTCYRAALDRGADYVAMLHGDGQYD
ncbi:MAG: glycosyltransferase family 2 protein, partial [Candidatus Binatia bacterium]